MVNEWVCSICGMKSGRKGNVIRHILNKHKGQGEPLSIMDYMLGVRAGEISPPSYQRPSGLPESVINKKQRPSDILIQHSFDKIKETLPKLKKLRGSRNITALKADVCNTCLTHKIFWYSRGNLKIGKLEHTCDMEWMLNNPIGPERNDAAIAVLNEKIPEYLARIFKELSGSPARLYSKLDYPVEHPTPRPEQIVIERIQQRERTLVDDYLILKLQDTDRSGMAAENVGQPNFINISSADEYAWLKRACDKGNNELTDEELVQFFSLTSSTIAKVEFQHQKYWLFVTIR